MKLLCLAVTTLTYLLIVGCGGDSPPQPVVPAAEETPLVDEAAPAPQPAAGEETTQESREEKGMLLPDNLPLPDETQPSAPDDGKPKGMQLPDDLQPSARHDAPIRERAATLVATPTAQTEPVPSGSTPSGSTPPKSTSPKSATSKPTPIKTDIQSVSWAEIERTIQTAGRVTVVDFWSLSCVPCLREFPHLVALQKKYPDHVRAIGVNVDFYGGEKFPPASYEPKVTAFLQTVGATFPNYICETASDEVFKSVKINALPAVLVFDETGKMTQGFTDATHAGGFTYEDDVIPAVEKCLAQ